MPNLTWNKWSLILLAYLLISACITLIKPIWLAPPHLFRTDVMYEILLLLWLPLFATSLVIKPIGVKRLFYIVSAIGISIMLYVAAILVFNLVSDENLGTQVLQYCTQTERTTSKVKFECQFAGYSEGSYILEFEGIPDTIFVTLVKPK